MPNTKTLSITQSAWGTQAAWQFSSLAEAIGLSIASMSTGARRLLTREMARRFAEREGTRPRLMPRREEDAIWYVPLRPVVMDKVLTFQRRVRILPQYVEYQTKWNHERRYTTRSMRRTRVLINIMDHGYPEYGGSVYGFYPKEAGQQIERAFHNAIEGKARFSLWGFWRKLTQRLQGHRTGR